MDTTVVHIADSAVEAEVVAGLLRSNGIEVITEEHASYAEMPTEGGEGVVAVAVPTDQAEEARRIIDTQPPATDADALPG
jgi:fructose-1,6-bisphosphatase/inositol monophosphatase family enzyme